MHVQMNKQRFGPWALITGASSGIGREFARQIAASGIHVVLVSRREELLREVGTDLSHQFGVQHRALAADLSEEGFITTLGEATKSLDIGLIISNAGAASPGSFLDTSREELIRNLRLNSLAHLESAHYFGRRLCERGAGGMVLVGAMGSDKGVPFMANDAAAKAYVQSLGLGLHDEFNTAGVYVTVLPPGPTETPVLAKLGFDPKTMPIKPMKVEQCVSEGLSALAQNRLLVIPGRTNRIMQALVPASLRRAMMMKMLVKALAGTKAVSHKQSEQDRGRSPRMQEIR